MSKYRIRMNGKTYEMEIELVDDKNEKTQRISAVSETSYESADSVVQVINPTAVRQTTFDNDTVKSPMPGSVIKIMVKPGDEVGIGEPVLILEAMKMENEICAPRSGKIKDMFVVEGQTVPGEAPLFGMESEEA